MTKKYCELFEQWKEKRNAPTQKWENWYDPLSCEDAQIVDSWETVYNYGYNKGYSEAQP